MLRKRFYTTVIHFNTWSFCIKSYCSTVCYKKYGLTSEFLEINDKRLSTYSDMDRNFGPRTKYIASFMWKQSLSLDEVLYRNSRPFKVCRIIKVSKRNSESLLIADHLSYKKWQRSNFLWRWRPSPSQVDYLLQKCFSYSLMMAMIIILRCGDVEINPGPKTSKLKLFSYMNINYCINFHWITKSSYVCIVEIFGETKFCQCGSGLDILYVVINAG